MELVSGPDVGGGFLFQLTVDGDGPLRRYTIHAQEGGIDGGDRVPGSPRKLGFVPVSSPCPIGGRGCWHEEAEAPAASALRVRFAYNRLRFVVGPVLDQAAGRRPVPFDVGAREAVGRIRGAMSDGSSDWFVGGSAAAALSGARVDPHDLDIGATREGVDRIGDALAEYLIAPVARRAIGTVAPRWSGRAFVGTLVDGLAVEWAELGDGIGGDGEWTAATFAEIQHVPFEGGTVPVAPLEYPLVKAAKLRSDRLAPLLAAVASGGGADPERLERALRAYDVPTPAGEDLRRQLAVASGAAARTLD